VQSVTNSLAVISLLGVVCLTFVVAALLREVRGLQRAMATVARAPRKQVSAFASRGEPPGDTFVLVASTHCPACEARARTLAQLASGMAERVVLLSADAGAAEWVVGSAVEVLIDPVLLGELAADVTPLALRYDPDGHERLRQPVGSDDDLRRLLGLNQQTANAK
jgi:hypothetical protein